MTRFQRRLDRIMPRHRLRPPRTGLEWDIRAVGLLRKARSASAARLLDISLDGALLEVPVDDPRQVGELVRIRLDGAEGTVQVRHHHPGETAAVKNCGVTFVDVVAMQAQINQFVDAAQGDRSAVREEWEKKRR